MATSASRCLFWVSSKVSLSVITSKFSYWLSAISSSIFGDSDCALAVSTFKRFLGCINLPAFVGGVSLAVMTRYLWSTVGCCPWLSLLFLLVAVVGTVDDRPYWFLSFFWS